MAQSFIERIRGAVSFFGLGIAPLPTTRDNAIPTITSGAGAPGTTPADGSLYLRTDGAAATTLYAMAAGAWGALTATGNDYGAGGILTDVIDESTGAAGVTIEGLLLKDRAIAIPDNAGDGITWALGGLTMLVEAGTTDVVVDNAGCLFKCHDDAIVFADPADTTKRARIDCGGVTAGQTRVLTMPDIDLNLTTHIADPGNGAAIPVTYRDLTVQIASGGVETRTLAIPTQRGQKLRIYCSAAVGAITIAHGTRLNQAGNTTMTFGAAHDYIELVGIYTGAAYVWQVNANDGVALS